MNTNLKQKSKLLLAGAITLGSLGTAVQAEELITPSLVCSYGECWGTSRAPLSDVTGLGVAEIITAQEQLAQLNKANIVTQAAVKLDVARRHPNLYNMPDPAEVREVQASNRERLARLRQLVQAAKEIK